MKRLLIAALMFAAPSAAWAQCHWEQDCSKGGVCKPIQICKSAIDLPALKPPMLPGIQQPTLKPLPSISLPPIGTKKCEQRYLCDDKNKCAWQDVCK